MSEAPTAHAVRALLDWERRRLADVHRTHFCGDVPMDWDTLRNALFVEVLSPACITAYWVGQGGLSGRLLSNPIERAVYEELTGESLPSVPLANTRSHITGQKCRRLWRAARGMAGACRKRKVPGVILTQSTQEGSRDPNWGPLLEQPELDDWLRLDFSYRRSGLLQPQRPGVIWDSLVIEAMSRYRQVIRRHLRSLSDDPQWRQSIQEVSVVGLPLGRLAGDFIHARLLQAARHSLQFNLAAQLLWRRVDARILASYRELVPPACQLIRAARQRRMRTVALQHGDLVPDLSIDLLPPAPGASNVPDVNCVFGRHYRDLLITQGPWSGGTVAITGMAWSPDRARPQHDPKGPVLIVSQTFVSSANEEAFHRQVAAAMAASRDIPYRVKLHPAQSERISRAGIYPPKTTFVAGGASFPEAARGCSAIVGCNSFALMEGLLASIPVVSVQLPAERIPPRPELSSMLLRAHDESELAELIDQARNRTPVRPLADMDGFIELDPGAQRLKHVLLNSVDNTGIGDG